MEQLVLSPPYCNNVKQLSHVLLFKGDRKQGSLGIRDLWTDANIAESPNVHWQPL